MSAHRVVSKKMKANNEKTRTSAVLCGILIVGESFYIEHNSCLTKNGRCIGITVCLCVCFLPFFVCEHPNNSFIFHPFYHILNLIFPYHLYMTISVQGISSFLFSV